MYVKEAMKQHKKLVLGFQKSHFCYIKRGEFSSDIFRKEEPLLQAVSL